VLKPLTVMGTWGAPLIVQASLFEYGDGKLGDRTQPLDVLHGPTTAKAEGGDPGGGNEGIGRGGIGGGAVGDGGDGGDGGTGGGTGGDGGEGG